MVDGVLAASTNRRQYEGKVTWFMLVTCLVAAMGGLLFGYEIGITEGVASMEPFQVKFFHSDHYKQMKDESWKESQYFEYDDEFLFFMLFTLPFYFPAIISAFHASTNTRMFGRKASMDIGGFLFLVGSLLCGFAVNIDMLFVGRALLGMGVGYCNQV
jgi:MFS transporter, SP family, sugar:H+ symporter